MSIETMKEALYALQLLKRAFFKNAELPADYEGWEPSYEDYEAQWVEPALKAIAKLRQAIEQAEKQDHFRDATEKGSKSTHKREWVGLDDDEIKECWDEGGSACFIYMNIEAKLKEKNI